MQTHLLLWNGGDARCTYSTAALANDIASLRSESAEVTTVPDLRWLANGTTNPETGDELFIIANGGGGLKGLIGHGIISSPAYSEAAREGGAVETYVSIAPDFLADPSKADTVSLDELQQLLPEVGWEDEPAAVTLSEKEAKKLQSLFKAFRLGQIKDTPAETAESMAWKNKEEGTAVFRTLLSRHSTRAYLPDYVPEEIVDRVLEAGLHAASGHNSQPWKFIVVRDAETRQKIVDANAEVLNRPGTDPFYGAPVIIIVLAERDNANRVCDGALAIGNMLLEAEDLGMGACWINRARETFDKPEWQEWLKQIGVEGSYEGIGHVALGFEAKEGGHSPRRKEGRVVKLYQPAAATTAAVAQATEAAAQAQSRDLAVNAKGKKRIETWKYEFRRWFFELSVKKYRLAEEA